MQAWATSLPTGTIINLIDPDSTTLAFCCEPSSLPSKFEDSLKRKTSQASLFPTRWMQMLQYFCDSLVENFVLPWDEFLIYDTIIDKFSQLKCSSWERITLALKTKALALSKLSNFPSLDIRILKTGLVKDATWIIWCFNLTTTWGSWWWSCG